MDTVSIARCNTYEPADISAALKAALAHIGGMKAFVSPGQRVLLKINLLSRAIPERAVTTHPEFVRGVIREVKAAGGIVTVGDSPGGPNAAGAIKRLWADTGIGEVCAQEDVPLLLFDDDCVRVPVEASTLYGAFTLGRAVVQTDVLITLPKLKTHGFMMFTGAVKNLFGCIPGLQKAQFHLKVPDRDDFANMLVDLLIACRPKLAIMDAVVGMEGEGPAGGKPRHVGAILASADSVALDVIAASIAGLSLTEVYTNRAAARRGLGPEAVSEVPTAGVDWHALAPDNFALPARDVTSVMPPWLGRRLRGWTTARPVLARSTDCTRCRKCEESCPVGAVHVGESGPVFDSSSCIRCYCCQELCPTQAIGLTTPPLARLAARSRPS
jgi:uncharacterized protein (DUF362 family)/Pyruvate/2-oxoacid:ferredoxin oxidoreductase delta subunit